MKLALRIAHGICPAHFMFCTKKRAVHLDARTCPLRFETIEQRTCTCIVMRPGRLLLHAYAHRAVPRNCNVRSELVQAIVGYWRKHKDRLERKARGEPVEDMPKAPTPDAPPSAPATPAAPVATDKKEREFEEEEDDDDDEEDHAHAVSCPRRDLFLAVFLLSHCSVGVRVSGPSEAVVWSYVGRCMGGKAAGRGV